MDSNNFDFFDDSINDPPTIEVMPEVEDLLLDEEHFIKKEKTEGIKVDVALDTEYNDSFYISIQARFKLFYEYKSYDFSFIIMDNKFSYLFSENKQIVSDKLVYIYFSDLNENKIEAHLLYFFQKTMAIECPLLSDQTNFKTQTYYFYLHIYFQIKDLTIAFGEDNMIPIYTSPKSKLYQRNGLSGYFS